MWFEIKELFISDSRQFKKSSDFKRVDSVFFQDESYVVRRTCSGEWGGSLWFKSKKTGIEYSCSATCPVSINKVGDKYVVTNSFAHFSWFTNIIEIENPELMEIFQMPEPRSMKSGMGMRYVGDDESKSHSGVKGLFDTIGHMILFTFPMGEQLYHIVIHSHALLLCKLKNNELFTIDTISNNLDYFNKYKKGIQYSCNTNGFKTSDNHYIVLFENMGLVGYLDIFEEKILLIRYQ